MLEIDIKPRALLSGLLSYLPGLYHLWDKHRPMGSNTLSAEYCINLWKFHLDRYHLIYEDMLPDYVGELGPGATLGTAIASLSDGVKKYVALDVGEYAGNLKNNMIILEEIITQKNKPEFLPRIKRQLELIFTNDVSNSSLQYIAPWNDSKHIEPNSLDFIYSHSTMEHVADPYQAYKSCFLWLKPGGVMSHRIDHSSHGITFSWNGHYNISEPLWKIIVGRKPFLLNRFTPEQHATAMKQTGFDVVNIEIITNEKHNSVSFLSIDQKSIKQTEIKTSTFLCKKPS